MCIGAGRRQPFEIAGLKNKLSLQGLPGEVLTIYEGAREAEVNDQLSRKVGKFFRRPQQSVLKDERC